MTVGSCSLIEHKGLASRVTASRYLSNLEELGILRSIQVHREKYFINYRLLNMLKTLRF